MSELDIEEIEAMHRADAHSFQLRLDRAEAALVEARQEIDAYKKEFGESVTVAWLVTHIKRQVDARTEAEALIIRTKDGILTPSAYEGEVSGRAMDDEEYQKVKAERDALRNRLNDLREAVMEYVENSPDYSEVTVPLVTAALSAAQDTPTVAPAETPAT